MAGELFAGSGGVIIMKKRTAIIVFMLLFAAMFAGCGGSNSGNPGQDVYRVYVTDEEEHPVEGVKVKFCSDERCRLEETDESGCALFDNEEPAVYKVGVVNAPEGYRQDDTVYLTEDRYGDLSIVLEKE